MRRYLIDTHLVYWWMTADRRLGRITQRLIERSDILVSAASIWEMILKNQLGKLPLPKSSVSDALESDGFLLLPILPRHVEASSDFTGAHGDPVDRLLIAQAREEKLVFLTRDAAILDLKLQGVVEA